MNRLLELMQKETLTTNEKVELFRGMNHSESKRVNLIEAHESAKRDLEEAEKALEEAQNRMDSINERVLVFATEDKMLNMFEQSSESDSGEVNLVDESSLSSQSSDGSEEVIRLLDFVLTELSERVMSIMGDDCEIFMNKDGNVIYTDGRFTVSIQALKEDKKIILYDKEMSISKRARSHYGQTYADKEFTQLTQETTEFINLVRETLKDYVNNGWLIQYSNEEGA